MKNIKYYIGCSLLMIFTILFAGCDDKEDLVEINGNDVFGMTLQLRQLMDTGQKIEWQGSISEGKDVITFSVPNNIAQLNNTPTDLTQVVLTPDVSYGSHFEPAIDGIIDLSTPIKTTIVSAKGLRRDIEIKVEKSKDAEYKLTEFSLPTLGLIATINEYDEIVMIVSPDYDRNQLKNVAPRFTVSPLSKVTPAMTEPQDFSQEVIYTVSAQDGSSRQYKTRVISPQKTDYGFGSSKLLWKKNGKELGFTATWETTMALINNKVVLCRRSSPFFIIDPLTGQKLGEVNTTGAGADGVADIVFGICSDNANHLLSVNFTRTNSTAVKICKWGDDLSQAPTTVLNLTMDRIKALGLTDVNSKVEFGRTISVVGDITGEAVIRLPIGDGGVNANSNPPAGVTKFNEDRILRFNVSGGVVTNPNDPIIETSPILWGWRSKIIPDTKNPANQSYFVISTGYADHDADGTTQISKNLTIAYKNGATVYNVKTNSSVSDFNPFAVIGGTYFEYNGAQYLFTMSEKAAWISNKDYREYNLIGHDVTNKALLSIDKSSPDYSKFFVFKSKEVLTTDDGKDIVSGVNGNDTGDVAAFASADGEKFYVITLATDFGMMVHEFSIYEAVK